MSTLVGRSEAGEAVLWEHEPGGTVTCWLCAHRCRIRMGLRGICRVRENRDGTLVSLVTNRVVARDVDPIEKKPLFHFLPGSLAYSVAAAGCNLHCLLLDHVYTGNIPGEFWESTSCPPVPSWLVHRRGFHVLDNCLSDGRCPTCHLRIGGVWSLEVGGLRDGRLPASRE